MELFVGKNKMGVVTIWTLGLKISSDLLIVKLEIIAYLEFQFLVLQERNAQLIYSQGLLTASQDRIKL